MLTMTAAVRHVVSGLLLGLSLVPTALAQTPDSTRPPARPWRVDCMADRCLLRMTAAIQDEMRNHEQATLVVDLQRSARQATLVRVLLPRDVVVGSEVQLRFIDSVPDGASFRLTFGSDLYALRVSACSADACAAAARPLLANGDGTHFDLFAALQKHSFLAVVFQRTGQKSPSRAMIPTFAFSDALARVRPVAPPR